MWPPLKLAFLLPSGALRGYPNIYGQLQPKMSPQHFISLQAPIASVLEYMYGVSCQVLHRQKPSPLTSITSIASSISPPSEELESLELLVEVSEELVASPSPSWLSSRLDPPPLCFEVTSLGLEQVDQE